MRVAIFGAGGIGGWLGIRLQQAGVDVVFIQRGAHGAAMASHGLKLQVLNKEEELETLELSVKVYSDVTAAVAAGEKVDCCVLCVKTFQVAQSASVCAPILTQNGFLVTTQNGISGPGDAAGVIGHARVIASTCLVLSYVKEPGTVCMQTKPNIWCIGEVFDAEGKDVADARSTRVDALHAAVSKAEGISLNVGQGQPVPNMWLALWDKASRMCSTGPISALTRSSLDGMANSPQTMKLLRSVTLEIVNVAAKSGCALTDDPIKFVEGRLNWQGLKSGTTVSTLRDFVVGKQSEVPESCSGVIDAAEKVNTPVPTMEFILAALLPRSAVHEESMFTASMVSLVEFHT